MKYLFSDYYFLCAAADKETRTVGDAYRKMCAYLGVSSTCSCLRHALRGLVAGGFLIVEPEEHGEARYINLGGSIQVTEAGRKAVSISPLQKLFGERKAFVKNQLRFCELERPDDPGGSDWWIDGDCLERINYDGVHSGQWAMPMFNLGDVGDGYLSLALNRSSYGYGDEDSDPDAPEQDDRITVTGDDSRIMAGVSDLLATVYSLLTEPPRTRKVAIHGADKSFVITLAHTAGDQGAYLRMTVAQIRFNRQRFLGKRDGELDYAQCGDPLLIREFSDVGGLAVAMLPCAPALPDKLSEADLDTIDALCKLLL